MEKMIGKTIHIIGKMIGILAALYIGLSVYYAGGFSYGTWVNGVYCTGKAVSEVNEELLAKETYREITLLVPDGTKETISMDEIGYRSDYSGPLLQIRASQKPWLWYQNLGIQARSQRILPEGSLDEDKFSAAFDALDFVKNRKNDNEYSVSIQKTENGYELVNEREQVLDYALCKETVKEAILHGEAVCDLAAADCYTSLPLTADMQAVLDVWERVEAFLNCGIVYRFGRELESISPAVVSDWIVVEDGKFAEDQDGNFLIDREKLEAYVDELADRYDTVGAQRQFQATRGDVVTISGGTYGNLIDRQAEKQYLYQAFLENRREVHEPSYLQEAKEKGRDDIGDTYIEVDMGNQHMYYYENGKLCIETPIVTGDMMKKRDTPAMVCFVYAKQKNRVLRGPGYASPVRYWMPVKGGIGIHDARWRDAFGGDIYKTQGSHGCINTPEEAMQQLYDMVEIGTPVVMFY